MASFINGRMEPFHCRGISIRVSVLRQCFLFCLFVFFFFFLFLLDELNWLDGILQGQSVRIALLRFLHAIYGRAHGLNPINHLLESTSRKNEAFFKKKNTQEKYGNWFLRHYISFRFDFLINFFCFFFFFCCIIHLIELSITRRTSLIHSCPRYTNRSMNNFNSTIVVFWYIKVHACSPARLSSTLLKKVRMKRGTCPSGSWHPEST